MTYYPCLAKVVKTQLKVVKMIRHYNQPYFNKMARKKIYEIFYLPFNPFSGEIRIERKLESQT